MTLTGFSPFAPREQDFPKHTWKAIDVVPGQPPVHRDATPEEAQRLDATMLPFDCARCGRWLVQSPAFHKTKDGYVCWPLCEDA